MMKWHLHDTYERGETPPSHCFPFQHLLFAVLAGREGLVRCPQEAPVRKGTYSQRERSHRTVGVTRHMSPVRHIPPPWGSHRVASLRCHGVGPLRQALNFLRCPGPQYGSIHSYNIDGGFGFIAPLDGGYTIFFHATDVAAGWRPPCKGHPLGFELGTIVLYDEGGSVNPAMQTQAYSVKPVRSDGRGGFHELMPPGPTPLRGVSLVGVPFHQPQTPQPFSPPPTHRKPPPQSAPYRPAPPTAAAAVPRKLPAVSRKLHEPPSYRLPPPPPPAAVSRKLNSSTSSAKHKVAKVEVKQEDFLWKDNHQAYDGGGDDDMMGAEIKQEECDEHLKHEDFLWKDNHQTYDGGGGDDMMGAEIKQEECDEHLSDANEHVDEDDDLEDDDESGDDGSGEPAEVCTEWKETGARLMKLMGWKEGDGLGKDGGGSTVPVAEKLIASHGKRGIVGEGERPPAPVHYHEPHYNYNARPYQGAQAPAAGSVHGKGWNQGGAFPQTFEQIRSDALSRAAMTSAKAAATQELQWQKDPERKLSLYLANQARNVAKRMMPGREKLTKGEKRKIRSMAEFQAAQMMRNCVAVGNGINAAMGGNHKLGRKKQKQQINMQQVQNMQINIQHGRSMQINMQQRQNMQIEKQRRRNMQTNMPNRQQVKHDMQQRVTIIVHATSGRQIGKKKKKQKKK
jgi:cold shock CspA family protein